MLHVYYDCLIKRIKQTIADQKKVNDLIRHVVSSTFLENDEVYWRPKHNWANEDIRRFGRSKKKKLCGPYDNGRKNLRSKTRLRVLFDDMVSSECQKRKHLLLLHGGLRQKVSPIVKNMQTQFWPVRSYSVELACKSFVSRHKRHRSDVNSTKKSFRSRLEGIEFGDSFANSGANPIPSPFVAEAGSLLDMVTKHAVTKQKAMCRLATEVGQSVLQAHIINAGLPPNTTYVAPDVCAVGFSAGLESAVWGTKERIPLLVQMGRDESLQSMWSYCVQQHNNAKWSSIKTKFLHAVVEQNVSQGKFEEIWRDSLIHIGKDLMIDDPSLKLTWGDVMQVRKKIIEASATHKFFTTNKGSSIAGVYCVDKAGYLEDTLRRAKVQVVVAKWRSVVDKRLRACKTQFERCVKLMTSRHLLIDLLDTATVPLVYTGDGATMYQLQNTNIRFPQTEISTQCLLYGVQSAYLLNPLIVYGQGDDAKYVSKALEGDASDLFTSSWRNLDINGVSTKVSMVGAVGDTKWIWQFLGRINDKCWSNPVGGSIRTRTDLCETCPTTGMTLHYPTVQLSTAFFKAMHEEIQKLSDKSLEKSIMIAWVADKLGVDLNCEYRPELGFDNCFVGVLHRIGTGSGNLMVDCAKIFAARNNLSTLYLLLSVAKCDVGLRQRLGKSKKSVQNYQPVGSTGQWVKWACTYAESLFGVKLIDLMSERELDKNGSLLMRYTWDRSLEQRQKREILLAHIAKVIKMPVDVTGAMMWDLHLWSEMCITLNTRPAGTTYPRMLYSHYDTYCHSLLHVCRFSCSLE